jgi:D-alanyl-lipoteichoic acid acyltransferase DltB (MBOAT superfamily)
VTVTFSSYVFLFVFLPVVVAGYYLLSRTVRNQAPAITWLVAASLVFYASLGAGYLLVLIASVLGNYLLGRLMMRLPEDSRNRKAVLIGGIVANLLLLASYKYTGFIADNLNAVFGTDFTALVRTYPVGLSFYTFIQIGFLLDAYVGQVKRLSFLRYTLFGTFFPYVTAGPLVRQDEVLQQLDTPVRSRSGVMHIAVGATMFAMGLFKKAVLADSVAPYVAAMFDNAGDTAVSAANAWIGALAYTFELYFDFSGYSDMAIGLAFMLGLNLPLNFNSPLRATSLVDFWRRWHMTMVRFFTSYVYTPLAVNMTRRTIRRKLPEPVRLLLVLCLPVFVTFVLVGFWHGAGWGFLISGAIHGVGLSVNLTWRELKARRRLPHIPSLLGWALMMVPLIASLVYLRAANAGVAGKIITAMLGLGVGGAGPATFYGTQTVAGLTFVPALVWLLLLAAVALGVPRNTQQLLERYKIGLPTLPSPEPKRRFRPQWRPSLRWAVAIAVVAGLALVFAGGPSPFLYYHY